MELRGLNKRQHQLATMMWELGSTDELDQMIENLPSDTDKRDCLLLLKLMLLEAFDQEVDGMQEFPDVCAYLHSF